MKMCALVAAVLTLSSVASFAQTNASKASSVGTWKLDAAKSNFGSQPAPKSVTLKITKDTPEACAWSVDMADDKGQTMSYSWSGPQDGTLQPVKDPKGQVVGQEGLKRDKDGALLRHGVDNSDGST